MGAQRCTGPAPAGRLGVGRARAAAAPGRQPALGCCRVRCRLGALQRHAPSSAHTARSRCCTACTRLPDSWLGRAAACPTARGWSPGTAAAAQPVAAAAPSAAPGQTVTAGGRHQRAALPPQTHAAAAQSGNGAAGRRARKARQGGTQHADRTKGCQAQRTSATLDHRRLTMMAIALMNTRHHCQKSDRRGSIRRPALEGRARAPIAVPYCRRRHLRRWWPMPLADCLCVISSGVQCAPGLHRHLQAPLLLEARDRLLPTCAPSR